MFYLSLYSLAFLIALVWAWTDRDAPEAFNFLRRTARQTARDMGLYQQYARDNLLRLALLTILESVCVVTALAMFVNNPFNLERLSRGGVLTAMFAFSIVLSGLPRLFAFLRFQRFVSSKTAHLADLLRVIKSETELQSHLVDAGYATQGGWTAWHPNQHDFDHNSLWCGLVPVAYLWRGDRPSVVVPVDFRCFLAWSFPADLKAGEELPFTGPGDTRYFVTRMRKVVGRSGWSIIYADMELDEAELAAA